MELYIATCLLCLVAMWDTVMAKPEKIFLKGYNSRNLPPGGWTAWFNSAHPGGTADDNESLQNIRRYYGRGCDGLPCRKPLAMKYISTLHQSATELGQRVLAHPRRGLHCYAHHQSDFKCHDYKVRFYCAGMDVLCRQKKSRKLEIDETYEKPDINLANEVLDKEDSETSTSILDMPLSEDVQSDMAPEMQSDFAPEVQHDIVPETQTDFVPEVQSEIVLEVLPDAEEDDVIKIADEFQPPRKKEDYQWIFGASHTARRKSRRISPHVYDFKTSHYSPRNHHAPWNWRRFD